MNRGPPELMTPHEVAELFRVNPKTVKRWANEGLLRTVRTLGGHRRYFKGEVMERFRQAHEERGA